MKGLKKLSLFILFPLMLSSCVFEATTPKEPDTGDEDMIDYSKYDRSEYVNNLTILNMDGTVSKDGAADPTIVRGEDGLFYIFSTGKRMLVSEDACNWRVASTGVIPQPTWGTEVYPSETNPYAFGVWAPDVVKIGNKWVYYYAFSGWGSPVGIGYATADNISGPYTDHGKLFTWTEVGIQNAIDPQVVQNDDGSVWMVLGSFRGIYLVRLTDNGLALYGGAATQKDEKILIAGYPGEWDESTYEGSYIKKHGEYWYYFGSAGYCCEGSGSTYRVYAARSKSLFGPYIDDQGFPLTSSGKGKTAGTLVVWAGISEDKIIAGPGHNSIYVDEAGEWWMYYHCYTNEDNFSARQLFMDKLIWEENGFPHVNRYVPSYGELLPGPCIAKLED